MKTKRIFFLTQFILRCLSNVLVVLPGKEIAEKVKRIYRDPREAIKYFEDKVLCGNTVITQNAWYEEKTPKSNLFGTAVFSACNIDLMKRDSYIFSVIWKGELLINDDHDIVIDIIDFDEVEDKIFYKILSRPSFF